MGEAIIDIKAIILAAGKGVRMNSELPKVLHKLNGKPLISHVIDNLRKAGISDIIVVVGYGGEQVISAAGDSAEYVWQRTQLGTGHAVIQAEEKMKSFQGKVIVACGDVPLIRAETFSRMIEASKNSDTGAVVLTMVLDNPTGYGRIMKNPDGSLERIIEEKDAAPGEKAIKEVNSGTYVFDSNLLFSGLKTIGTDNAQKEYYLPDALAYIRKAGYRVRTLPLDDPTEGSGINSKEELERLERLLIKR
jgi:bifunctional UDP-N-acetylglucosamine pyrophosphorylase/glucosamine-1-phosphate N-acetyltransferase